MPYSKAKVYSDGSHYIAIPHTERPYKVRVKPKEDVILVPDETEKAVEPETDGMQNAEKKVIPPAEGADETTVEREVEQTPKEKKVRQTTKKKLFDELYKKHYGEKSKTRKKILIRELAPYFKNVLEAKLYVESNLRRKKRNLIARRIRMTRKANLQSFNYFVTFTYDSTLHTEETFRKKLKYTLGHFSNRKGWRYIGVWERSPEKNRLHFHGMFYVPEGTMPGEMKEENSYSFSDRKRQITHENTYFRERFGRNDFKDLSTVRALGEAVSYILKYIEKTGEKIVYSKGLPQFFVSDIMDDDVLCPMGENGEKLLLFDDFSCYDDGCYMGKVSKEVIAKMPKEN